MPLTDTTDKETRRRDASLRPSAS